MSFSSDIPLPPTDFRDAQHLIIRDHIVSISSETLVSGRVAKSLVSAWPCCGPVCLSVPGYTGRNGYLPTGEATARFKSTAAAVTLGIPMIATRRSAVMYRASTSLTSLVVMRW